jgi:uncharacterized membrane protein YkvA (DUF1232 family)
LLGESINTMTINSKQQDKAHIPKRDWRLRLRRDLIYINKQVRLLSLLVGRPEVPWPAKIVGGCAIGYIFSPIQLIPTFVPVIGQMDDLLVLFLGTRVVRKFTPASVLRDCEKRADLASSAQIERWEHILCDYRQSRPLTA